MIQNMKENLQIKWIFEEKFTRSHAIMDYVSFKFVLKEEVMYRWRFIYIPLLFFVVFQWGITPHPSWPQSAVSTNQPPIPNVSPTTEPTQQACQCDQKHAWPDGSVGPGCKHLNPDNSCGGWVQNTASADATSWVYPNAIVYAAASVSDESDISDSAVVTGNATVVNSTVADLAHVGDSANVLNSNVTGNAWVYGEARINYSDVQDYGRVFGFISDFWHCTVSGHAQVSGSSNQCTNAYNSTFKDYAIVQGGADIKNSTIYENATISGPNLYIVDSKIHGHRVVTGGPTRINIYNQDLF